MNYSFEYIDIILLAMIAGFIFLRLRGILGKRTGFEGKNPQQFQEILKEVHQENNSKQKEDFDKKAQSEFLKGAKIAYETIITDFSDNDNMLIASKPLLSKKIYDQFDEASAVHNQYDPSDETMDQESEKLSQDELNKRWGENFHAAQNRRINTETPESPDHSQAKVLKPEKVSPDVEWCRRNPTWRAKFDQLQTNPF